MSISRYQFKKRKLALVIPAHNEELVIRATIQSAIRAGQPAVDIFVVADGCTDKTVQIAVDLLGNKNVLSKAQGGKAMAILSAIKHFKIEDRYQWMHIADADGLFADTYFVELISRLNKDYVAATGYIQSLQGGWISKYRTYEYTLGLELVRRIQAFFGVIPVIPGPTSVYRTDVLKKLDFTVGSIAEDMDLTLQIHRGKFGKILYVPQAKTFTQDPKDLGDYMKQVSRWYRGNFQVILRHKVGLRPQKIDFYMTYVVMEQWFMVLTFSAIAFWAWWSQNYTLLSIVFLNDLFIFMAITFWAAAKNGRSDVAQAFPLFYILRFVSIYIFMRSWYEIVVQRKFNSTRNGWSTAGRRYRIVTDAAIN